MSRSIGATALSLWLAIAAIATAPAARAGNTEWSFEVLEVTQVGPDTNLIRLRPAPPGDSFPRSCETFVVHSFYDVEEWSRAGRRRTPRSTHTRSIQMLLQAQAMRTLVRIRSYRHGFGAQPEAPRCEVTSRALTIAPDPGGAPVILSFYEDPGPGN